VPCAASLHVLQVTDGGIEQLAVGVRHLNCAAGYAMPRESRGDTTFRRSIDKKEEGRIFIRPSHTLQNETFKSFSAELASQPDLMPQY
jgi:hypothetical protein